MKFFLINDARRIIKLILMMNQPLAIVYNFANRVKARVMALNVADTRNIS